MKTRNVACLVCAAALLQSCAADENEEPASIHRVEATRTFQREQFSTLHEYSLRETLRISGDEVPAGYEIVTPMGVVSPPDGSIYVLDGGSFDVIAFDSSGHLVRRFGGQGEGPGEFTAPLAIALAPDTIFVLDRMLHAFSLSGEFYYSMAADTATKLTRPNHFAYAGNSLVLARTRSSRQEDVQIDTVIIQVRSAGARDFSQQFTLPGDTFYVRGEGTYFHRLLGTVPHMAVTRAGKILLADGADYHIDVMSLEGTLEERIVGEVAPKPITRQEFEDLLEQAEASSRAQRNNPRAADISRIWRQLPRADFRPVVGRLLPGDGRLVLVERKDAGPLGERPINSIWDIINLDDGPLGRVSMPEGFVPWWFSRGQVYGIDHSEMGSPLVVRYALDPSR